jgi:NADH oxidase (H2O2-forming)
VLFRSFPDYLRDGIEMLSQRRVTGISTEGKSLILENERINYDKLIIACGSKPFIPSSIDAEKGGVFTFKSLSDTDKIARWDGRSAVVIGSGPIGLEAGLALRRKGYHVVILELLPHVLPKAFDEYPAGLVKEILERNGIEVFERERLVEIQGTERVSAAITDKRTIKCDTVILATGMKPRGSWVFGKVDVGERGGILVNEKMATSVADIFACGDCVDAPDLITGQPVSSMLWHNARRQGEIAGYNAAGITMEYAGSLNVTGINIFGIQAVSVGMTGNEASEGLDVIEREREDAYQRVIFQRSEVVGVQSVNWGEDIGLLLTSLIRKEKVAGISDALAKRRPPLRGTRPFVWFGRC